MIIEAGLRKFTVIDLVADISGNLWIAAWKDGLYRFSPKTETFTRFDYPPSDSERANGADGRIVSVNLDKAGILWIGTPDGISRQS